MDLATRRIKKSMGGGEYVAMTYLYTMNLRIHGVTIRVIDLIIFPAGFAQIFAVFNFFKLTS